MSVTRLNAVVMITSLASFAACSKSDGGGNATDPYGNRQIDLSGFKNTASADDLRSRGTEVGGYFKDLGSVKGSFVASGAGNGFVGFAAAQGEIETATPVCETSMSQEEQPTGDLFTVVTETCSTDEEDGTTRTCTKVKKYTADGLEVSTAETCTTYSSSHHTSTTDAKIDSPFVPAFDTVDNCADAFDSFEQTYAGVKTEFDNIYGMLVKPTGLSLSGVNLTNQGELQQREANEQSALAFDIVAPEQDGIDMKGSISGGADGDVMVIRQQVELSMDMGLWGPRNQDGTLPNEPVTPTPAPQSGMKMAMNNAESIAVDAGRKLIEMDIDSVMTMEMPEGGAMTTTTKGRIAVSAGTDKFVTSTIDFASKAGQQGGVAARVETETRLVDANKLSYRAVMHGADASQSGQLSFDLVRTADKKCEVINLSNSTQGR